MLASLLLLALVSTLHADEKKTPLAEARLRWLKGNYAEARELYQEQSRTTNSLVPPAPSASLVATSVKANCPRLSPLSTRRSKRPATTSISWPKKPTCSTKRGKWDEALKLAEKAIKAKDEHFLARWVRRASFAIAAT